VNGVEAIPIARLTLAFVPVAVVLLMLWHWRLGAGNALYALGRMLAQLVLIGYLLTFIFAAEAALYLRALGAIAAGGVITLLLVTQGVLGAEPWYAPRVVIPLAGMIFANAMTAVSLAGERYQAELDNGKASDVAQRIAFQAALIPQINALLAVGLVSLPGMMTGQILSGVSPLLAVRYQIMVMAMIFGSAGIASAVFLALQGRVASR
jgi:putative ABC transport system permease protein